MEQWWEVKAFQIQLNYMNKELLFTQKKDSWQEVLKGNQPKKKKKKRSQSPLKCLRLDLFCFENKTVSKEDVKY